MSAELARDMSDRMSIRFLREWDIQPDPNPPRMDEWASPDDVAELDRMFELGAVAFILADGSVTVIPGWRHIFRGGGE